MFSWNGQPMLLEQVTTPRASPRLSCHVFNDHIWDHNLAFLLEYSSQEIQESVEIHTLQIN